MEIVTIEDNELKTNSIKISKHFNISHKHVLQKIKELNLTAEISAVRLFVESEFKSERGRTLPMYTMGRDGYIFLVMQFSSAHGEERKAKLRKKQLEYIKEFNRMERIINEQMFEINNLTDEIQTLKELLPTDPKGTISKANGKPRNKIVKSYQRSTNGKEKVILDGNIKMFQASFKI